MTSNAKKFIKSLLLDKELTYVQLSKLMKDKGYNETPDTIRTKVNRGTFSFVFLLEICDTLDIDLTYESK